MKKYAFLFSLTLLILANAGFAQSIRFKVNNFDPVKGTDLTLPKDTLVAIDSYNKDSKTYQIYSVELPGEGYSIVAPKELARTISSLDYKEIKKDPEKIVGMEYTLSSKIPTFFAEEIALRKKKIAKKEKRKKKKIK